MPVPALLENVPQVIRAIGYADWQTFLIEFGIVVMLFFTAIKQALAVGSAARQSYGQHNMGGLGHNIFGSSQHKQTNNVLALILGFGAAYLLFFKYKITLGTIAENGIMSGLFALAAGMTAYGFMSARLSQENRFWGFMGAAVVGLIVYSWLSLKTASFSGALGGFVPLLIFGLILLAFVRFGAPATAPAGAGAPAAPRQPVPPGPAGAPVAAENASGAVETAVAAVQATTEAVNNAAPAVNELEKQHDRTERAAGDAVSAVERAEEEVEARAATPAPEEDVYSRNVMAAAEEGRDLAEEAQKEIQLADAVSTTWGNISEDAFAARETEAVRQVEIAVSTLETIESSVRDEPAAATVIPVIEEERHNLDAAREMLTSGAAVAVREAGFLRENIRNETAQMARWKEEVRPIALSIMALVSSIEQKKLPAPKLQEALAELGTLEKRFLQITKSHGVDPGVLKEMLPAVRSRLEQSAKTLVQVNNMLEASQKRLTAVPRALLARPKEETFVDTASLNRIALLIRHSKELMDMVQAIEQMKVKESPSQAQLKLVNDAARLAGTWYAGDIVTVRNTASAIMKGGMEDLAGILSPQHLGVLENLANYLASLLNAFQSGRERSQPLSDTLANFHARQYSVRLSALIKDLEFVLRKLSSTA